MKPKDYVVLALQDWDQILSVFAAIVLALLKGEIVLTKCRVSIKIKQLHYNLILKDILEPNLQKI